MRSREDADAWGWAPPSKHRSLGGRPLRTSSLPRPVPGGGQEQTDTWSLGGERPEGSKPHKRQGFLQLFPLFRFFSISSDINFVCAVVVLFLKEITSGLGFLQTQAPGEERGRHKHATGRPCARGQLGSKHRVCPVKPAAAALKRGGPRAGRSASGGRSPSDTGLMSARWAPAGPPGEEPGGPDPAPLPP